MQGFQSIHACTYSAVCCAADDWIEIDEHYTEEIDERMRLLEANSERVVGCIPEVSHLNFADSLQGILSSN